MFKFLRNFKENYFRQGFPIISVSLLTGIVLFKQNKISIFRKSEIPKLPPKDTTKPTILLDYNLIIKNKVLFFFPFKRRYTDEFLFHLCQLYELVSITNIPYVSSKEVDPYGCISYHYFLPKKSDLRKEHLARDDLICITKDKKSFHNEFSKNILEIKTDFQDEKLFTLLDFFNNLYFTNKETWSETVQSYKDFFKEFDSVYKKLFYQKNLLNFFSDFDKEREKINLERIREYNSAKLIMDENLKKYEFLEEKNFLIDFIKKAVSFLF